MFDEKLQSGSEVIRGGAETPEDRFRRQRLMEEQRIFEEGQRKKLEKMKTRQAEDDRVELDRNRADLYEVIANRRIIENREETIAADTKPVSATTKESSTNLSTPVKKTGLAGLFQRVTRKGRAERAQADFLNRADGDIR